MKKETATAKQPKKETAEANDKRAAALKKIRILGGVAWLGLPWNHLQEIVVGKDIERQQAEELIASGYAERV